MHNDDDYNFANWTVDTLMTATPTMTAAMMNLTNVTMTSDVVFAVNVERADGVVLRCFQRKCLVMSSPHRVRS